MDKNDDILTRLFLEWETHQEAGEPASPEEVCRNCPELLDKLQQRIDLLWAVNLALDLSTAEHVPAEPGPLPSLPGFEILEELGHGGLGIVYRVRETSLKRFVALKMPRRRLFSSPQGLVRFEREAQALAMLEHEGIVHIYHYQSDPAAGGPFLTMQLVTGGTLLQQQARYVKNPRAAATLMEQVARAVHYAHTPTEHRGGILHRDLKPSNILIGAAGRPLVSDFGLAKLFAELEATEGVHESTLPPSVASPTIETPRDNLTRTGQAIGTLPYMAPEQLSDSPNALTPATDVWSLGIILYELLTGERPFGPDDGGMIKRIKTAALPRIRDRIPNFNARLESICLKCLEKDPARRYATAEALANDLQEWLQPPSRPLKRWVLPGLVALTGLAALIVWLSSLPPRPPDSGGQGINRWLAPVIPLSASELVKMANADEPFPITSLAVSLYEVQHAPRVPYQLSAEIHHTGNHGADSVVGIYSACQRLDTDVGTKQFYWTYAFSDQGARLSRPELKIHCLSEPSFYHAKWIRLHKPEFRMDELPRSAAPYRAVVLQVREADTTFILDGRVVATLGREEANDWIQKTLAESTAKPRGVVLPPPEGGTGFFVRAASLQVRRLRIGVIP